MVKRRTKFSLLTEQEDAFQRPLFSAEESDPTTSTPDDLASTALLWLECQPLPHAMLSKELSILWVNAKARAVLAEKRDVQSRNETFTTVDPLHQQDLHNFLINSTSSLTSWSMRRSDGDGRVIFRAQKFEKTPSSIIAVTFFGSGSDFQPAYVDLERPSG